MDHTSPLYLDYAAATPVDSRVFEAMRPYFSEEFYNPSALYGAARSVRAVVERARADVANCLGARPTEIVFTAGGSEANNLALHGVMRRYPDGRVLVSAIEHDSVREAVMVYRPSMSSESASPESRHTSRAGFVPVTAQGLIDSTILSGLIDDKTVLISIMYANNEIGTIQPIRDIAAAIASVRHDRRTRHIAMPLYLHVDAAQAANYLDIQVSRLGVDLMSLNGGKIYGPKQTGALYVRTGVLLEPLVYGGGQEGGLRSGTENVPGIVGFAYALRAAQAARRDESRRLQAVQRYFITQLTANIPGVIVNGSQKHRLPNNVHITIPGADNERLLFALDEAGIMAAAGSACSASSEVPSHVLQACGLSDAAARSSLRFTMGRATTVDDIDRVVAALHSF